MKVLIIVCLITPLAFILVGNTGIEAPTTSQPIIKEQPAQPIFIEINQVPPPFNLGGADPYVIWVNGARVNVPDNYIHPIIKNIGEENIKPIDIPNLHKGWLHPHFFEQPEKETQVGRTRSLNDKQQPQSGG